MELNESLAIESSGIGVRSLEEDEYVSAKVLVKAFNHLICSKKY